MVNKTISGCYAPPDVLDNTQRRGWHTPGSKFGNMAEHPIFTDYVVETHGSWMMAVEANRTTRIDWGDSGFRESFIREMVYHHPSLHEADLRAEAFKMPDILTTGGPIPIGSGIVLHNRNEFYEIKPDSTSGRSAGRNKVREIESLFQRHGLVAGGIPFYAPGVIYPRSVEKKISMPANKPFEYAVRVFMRSAGFTRVRMYMHIRRMEAGILVYKLCVEIDQDQDLSQQESEDAASGVAKHLYALWLLFHDEQVYDEFKKVEPDHSYRGNPFPLIRCRFDALPELKPWYPRIERNMFTRGIGLPGEEFIVACDESFYRRMFPSVPAVSVSDYWRKALVATRQMITALGGEGAWNLVEPIVLSAKDMTLERLNLIYPDMEFFVNTVLAWVERNPGYTIVIVLGAVVVTAAVAAFWEAALLPAAEEIVEALFMGAAQSPGALGRIALTGAQESRIFAAEQQLARTIAPQGGPIEALEVARQSLGASASAESAGATVHLLKSPVVKRAAITAAAAGFAMVVNTTEAYARPSSGEIGTSTPAVNLQNPIATHADSLFVLPSVPWPPPKRPIPGRLTDISQYVLGDNHAGNPFGERTPVYVRYLGHLQVT